MKEFDVPEMYKQGRTAINPPQESLTRLEDQMYQSAPNQKINLSLESYRNLLVRSHVPEEDIERMCATMEKNIQGLNYLETYGAIETKD